MTRKKIAFLINSLDGGGAERVVSTLLNNLVDEYECHLILMEKKMSYTLDNRINIIHLNENSNQNGILKLIRLPLMAYKLKKIIKNNNFTQVVSFLHRANYVNSLSKYISSHQVVLSERIASSSMYSNYSITSKISKYLIKKLYKKADLIIPVSNAIKNDLIENFNIQVEQKVIYNPYDIENINKLSQESIDINIDREKAIITVGSLCERKNHKLIINAFKNIDDTFKLYILGVGSEENNLKQLVKELNIENRVIFLGFDNNPYKYLSKCDIFILGSNSEGFPNVLAEAMVCGCSVISTDCLSGPREILAPDSDSKLQIQDSIEDAEFGVLTPINNESKMTEAINLMIKNKNNKKVKQRANDFKIEKIIEEYKEVICVE